MSRTDHRRPALAERMKLDGWGDGRGNEDRWRERDKT